MSINGRKVSAFAILRVAGLRVRVKRDLAEAVRKIAERNNITRNEAATRLVAEGIGLVKKGALL